ncbi:D-alanine--D-alanine ligase family protein [Catenulispora rubra]|uniref:D-alanine--D-alanine ligase family protein n=1 Tax=Catenulispora rubra TaxID=280293 RepID=UPI0018924688|nr:D-alanine--D-alanine ligase family protein [Catenulispora rubra]
MHATAAAARTDLDNDLLQVGIFYGGPSAEHDVSCASAKAVVRNLRADRYALHAIGVTKSGQYMLLPAEALEYARTGPVPQVAIDDLLPIAGTPVELLPHRSDGSLSVVYASDPSRVLARIDVAFPMMHGAFGEDGVFQGLLEAFGVRYVGCGVGASAIGMDKVAMKRALRAEGLPVTPYVVLTAEHRASSRDFLPLVSELRWPLFVKPAGGGSSIGVTRVSDPGELQAAIDLAFSLDPTVIVEQGVDDAREFDCGVLVSPDGEPWASLAAEIDVDGGLLDFRQKYQAVDSRLVVPADLPDKVAAQMRAMALEAFGAIGGFGLARVDFLWNEQADELYVCEINTMPGFTTRSSFARAWDASGVPMPQLLSWLIDLALLRPARYGVHAGRAGDGGHGSLGGDAGHGGHAGQAGQAVHASGEAR